MSVAKGPQKSDIIPNLKTEGSGSGPVIEELKKSPYNARESIDKGFQDPVRALDPLARKRHPRRVVTTAGIVASHGALSTRFDSS